MLEVMVLRIDLPGTAFSLENLVLDVNGTIAFDGEPVPGVREALTVLASDLRAVAITADTRGTARQLAGDLSIDVHVISPGDEAAQKAAFVRELGPDSVVAIGNGANDEEMLREAAIGIAVLGTEGASAAALAAADVVVFDIMDALGLLAEPRRLVATLRR
jgi:P-type E1-E2 ATPase